MLSDVSVVVCTHRLERWPWLLECLDSIAAQTLQPREVIVVVDGSPEIQERLRDRDGPEITVATPRPSGLSTARNLGVRHASGRFVAFLDDDATAARSWLKALRAVLDDDTVAGVGGVSLPRWEGGRPEWMPDELLWALGCSYLGMPATRSKVRNVHGGSACYRRDIFARYGGFNVHLGRTAVGLAGCEETELCLRVRESSPGLRFVHEPDSVIYHRVPRDRERVSYLLSRCIGEGRSKAILLAVSGGRNWPLGSEASYLTRTVPRGIALNIGHFFRGDRWGMIRAALLIVAVANTVIAYEATRLQVMLRLQRFDAASGQLIGDSAPSIIAGRND